MGKKSGVPKSRKRKEELSQPCSCYYCTGITYEEWLKKKYDIKPKHKNRLKFS